MAQLRKVIISDKHDLINSVHAQEHVTREQFLSKLHEVIKLSGRKIISDQ